ncbi:MAG: CDP-diacylglycerol--glycerol-3-phosphate 3-phosphatidyltransferase [Clostridia bacterium]|nr:CDP-diacylglycerol--glycerol-3-phosphate 3-phosphatidyltransferase [Clostridia bacterium]
MKVNKLPNILTVIRMALIPVFMLFFYLDTENSMFYAAVIFTVAYITDMLDGMIARKCNAVSDFGKLMDPIADKLLSIAAVVMLTEAGILSGIVTFIIIAREIIISGFRLVWAADGRVVAADKLGKLKTVLQFAGILLILLENPVFRLWNIPMDMIVMYASVVISVISCVNYIVKNTDKKAGNK